MSPKVRGVRQQNIHSLHHGLVFELGIFSRAAHGNEQGRCALWRRVWAGQATRLSSCVHMLDLGDLLGDALVVRDFVFLEELERRLLRW